MVCYIVINSFFVSFEISGGSYNSSQNTLRLVKEFEKCILSFMESLIPDFIQCFISAREIWHETICTLNFVILLKFPHFLSRLKTRE